MTARPAYAPVIHAAQHYPGGIDDLAVLTSDVPALSVRLECYGRNRITGTSVWTTGRMQTVQFNAPLGCPAYSKMGTTIAVGGTATSARIVLYRVESNGDYTLLARTAIDGTISASGDQIRSMDTTGGFPASFTPVAGQRYALGLWFSGGGMPTPVQRSYGSSAVSIKPPKVEVSINGVADPATSYSNPITAVGVGPYMWLEP